MANFEQREYGFWRQTDVKPFIYDQTYKNKQSTNDWMAFLRIGWLSAYFDYKLKGMTVVDVGSGNGSFVRAGQAVFKKICGYDVAGESISESELLNTQWDLAVFSDVIEHMPDLEHLFKIPWKWAFVSFPETPKVDTQDQLHTWRHFKPNEHIWCLNIDGITKFANDHDCIVMRRSNMEDLIRTRWDPEYPNISSVLIMRD